MKDPLLNSLNIEITTNNGIVQLSGKIDTDMQYEQAVLLASSTTGVSSVNAQLLMVKDSKQPIKDIYITAKIKGLLLKEKIMGKDIQYWPIDIETKNSVVYLKGFVDTEQQKQMLVTIVNSVQGVKSINDAITVKNKNAN